MIEGVTRLEDLLSEPPEWLVETMRHLPGDIVVLGIAGKMGPTLARMALRASQAAGIFRRVIGVSRFSVASEEDALQSHGIETIRCDLLDEQAVAQLPDAANVVFMAGRKFGSTGAESLTWAMNCLVPAIAARRYNRSKIVAFSTGNVYGLAPVASGGSVESDMPRPVGEYAMSCLGRERVFEHFARQSGTPIALVRLNYAAEMRYGVLLDMAQRVFAREPVDVSMGYFNVIWQGDANAIALQLLAHVATPPLVVNVTGAEQLSVRETCLTFGRLMNRDVVFTGQEAPDAILSNASKVRSLMGAPRVSATQLIEWTADWVMRGRTTLDKPTHFDSRDGTF